MTLEIKQRMEQIENGDVPEGYKKTRIGVIPDAWEFKKLSQLLSFKNGINGEKDKFGKGVKLISVRDILSDSPIYYHTVISQVDVTDNQLDEFGVTYGDILFQRSSENYEEAGTSNVYLDEENTAVFSGFVIRGKKCADYNPVYLNAVLKLPCVRKSIVRQAAGAQHVNIGQNSIANIGVPFASLVEQQKIAEILTTQDKVIELKERLISEKQRQKKYLLQKIFASASNYKYLEEFSVITMGQSPASSSYNANGIGLPLVQGNADIQQRIMCPRMYTSNPTKKCKMDDILISVRAPVGSVARSNRVACIGRGICAIDASKYQDYLYQFLLYYEDKWGKVSQGSTFESISGDDIKKLHIPIVDNINQVVNLLSTADREIELLQQELEQEKQKKKALMQLLLTGIVRVNI